MNLGRKTISIIGSTTVVLLVLLFVFAQRIMLHYVELSERTDLTTSARLVQNAISNEIASLETLAGDWTAWNNAYVSAFDADPEFLRTSPHEENSKNTGLSYVFFFDSKDQMLPGKTLDLREKSETPISEELLTRLGPESPLLAENRAGDGMSGLLNLEEGVLAIAARTILQSSDPSAGPGTLILAAYLDDDRIEGIANAVMIPFEFVSPTDPVFDIGPEEARIDSQIGSALPFFIVRPTEDLASGYAWLRDLDGEPTIPIRIDLERTSLKNGQAAVLAFIGLMAGLGALYIFVTLLLFRALVLSRMAKIGARVKRIGKKGDLSERIAAEGSDELASLGGEIDQMLERLQHSDEALRESQQRLTWHLHQTPLAAISWDVKGRVTEWNPSAERIFGYSKEQAIGRSANELIVPVRIQASMRNMVDRLTTEQSAHRQTNENITQDGRTIVCEWYNTPLLDPDGQLVGAASLARDITERIQAEEELKRSEANLKLAQSIASIGSWEWNIGEDQVSWSEELANVLGVAPGAGANDAAAMLERVHPDDTQKMMALATKAQEEGSRFTIEHRIFGQDGEIRHLRTEGQVELASDGKPVRMVGTSQNITEIKGEETKRLALEEQLRHTQKMDAIGTLAGGIAHDFGNLISAISRFSDLAKASISNNHRAHESLGMLEETARQAQGVVRSLLTYARSEDVEKEAVDLLAILKRSLRLMEWTLPKKTVIEIEGDSENNDPVWVLGEPSQLQQVITNLAINSSDAMPEGGKIKVSLRSIYAGDQSEKGSTAAPAPPLASALLRIEDEGEGMSEEILERVFEPFFSTKEKGKGTGLGLAVTHGIVEDHGGTIEFQSEPGKGTIVEIVLTCCGEPQQVSPPSEEYAPAGVAGGKLVLVVEDDAYIRSILVTGLRSEGYEVQSAAQCDEGMQYFRDAQDRLALVLINLDLPKKSGIDCMAEIRKSKPELPVILLSEDAEKDQDSPQDEFTLLVAKPFSLAELTRLIQNLLSKTLEVTG